MADRDTTDLSSDRRQAHLRLIDLERRALEEGPPVQLVEETLAELRRNLQARQVAEEELRAQRQQLEDALLALVEEQQRYRELFEYASVGYLTTDLAGTLRDANRAAARLLGRDRPFLVGKPLGSLVAREDAPAFQGWLRSLPEMRRPAARRLTLLTPAGEAVEMTAIAAVARPRAGEPTELRWMLGPGDAEVPATGEALPLQAPDAPTAVASVQEELSPVRITVFYDSPLFVRGLDLVLNRLLPGVATLVGATADRQELDDLVLRLRPDAVLVEFADDRGVLDTVRNLKERYPQLGVLALTDAKDSWDSLRAMQAGADGVLPHRSPAEAVVGPLLAVAEGWSVLAGELSRRLVERAARHDAVLARLSDEERELWAQIAGGARDSDIARQAYVSTRTVKRRVAALFRKLGVSSRIQASALAGQVGLLDAQLAQPS